MFKLLALAFACSFWGICIAYVLHRLGMLPAGALLRTYRRLPWYAQLVLILFVAQLLVYGSTKTNAPPMTGSAPFGVVRERGVAAPSAGYPPAKLPAGADRRGARTVRWVTPVQGEGVEYSLYSTQTNETYDFSMPADAVVATNWLDHGAATAWIRVKPSGWEFPFGTNVYTAFAVSSDGRVMPDPTGRIENGEWKMSERRITVRENVVAERSLKFAVRVFNKPFNA